MKKRIRKTGEIVDIIYFGCNADRKESDHVDYVDSQGREMLNVPMNFYWDFEDIEQVPTAGIDWEQRRFEIAKNILPVTCEFLTKINVDDRISRRVSSARAAEIAVEYADALVAKLKEGGGK